MNYCFFFGLESSFFSSYGVVFYVLYSPLFAPWALVSMQELFPYLFGN